VTAETVLDALYGGTAGAVVALVGNARAAAAMIRDRFPPDAWRALDDLARALQTAAAGRDVNLAVETTNGALRSLAALAGLELENMSRIVAWRFLRLGRRIERGIGICRVVRQLTGGGSDPDLLDALLEVADSQITYRTRYMMGAARAPVVDLVMFDDNNPRSLAFQIHRSTEHLAKLPGLPPDGRPSPALATLAALQADFRRADPHTVTNDTMIGFENRLMQLSNDISQSWFTYRGPARMRS
jgi:uncharacterized alpha-E superfamily protein